MELRNILEELMVGTFICPVTNEAAYHVLSTDDGLRKVNAAMLAFEREVSQLPDNGAFYLVSTNINNKSDKSAIRRHFEECRDIVEPVVSFLVLISRVEPESGILTANQIIRFTDILSSIAKNDLHIQQLNQLMTLKLFKTSKQGTEEKLKSLFKGMATIGLIVEKNDAEMVYQVTGKLDYIHHIINFIADHENIDISENTDSQSEMAL